MRPASGGRASSQARTSLRQRSRETGTEDETPARGAETEEFGAGIFEGGSKEPREAGRGRRGARARKDKDAKARTPAAREDDERADLEDEDAAEARELEALDPDETFEGEATDLEDDEVETETDELETREAGDASAAGRGRSSRREPARSKEPDEIGWVEPSENDVLGPPPRLRSNGAGEASSGGTVDPAALGRGVPPGASRKRKLQRLEARSVLREIEESDTDFGAGLVERRPAREDEGPRAERSPPRFREPRDEGRSRRRDPVAAPRDEDRDADEDERIDRRLTDDLEEREADRDDDWAEDAGGAEVVDAFPDVDSDATIVRAGRDEEDDDDEDDLVTDGPALADIEPPESRFGGDERRSRRRRRRRRGGKDEPASRSGRGELDDLDAIGSDAALAETRDDDAEETEVERPRARISRVRPSSNRRRRELSRAAYTREVDDETDDIDASDSDDDRDDDRSRPARGSEALADHDDDWLEPGDLDDFDDDDENGGAAAVATEAPEREERRSRRRGRGRREGRREFRGSPSRRSPPPPAKPAVRKILIDAMDEEEMRIAVLADGELEDLHYERTSDKKYLGNIYKGRVVNLEPGIQAAFVDLGIGRNGFLHVSDVLPIYKGADSIPLDRLSQRIPDWKSLRIQDILRKGQEVLVQISKDSIGAKGPSLTTYVSIPGKYLVLMPGVSRHGVSKRIQDGAERAQLRAKLAALDPPEGVGYIVRTAGQEKPPEILEKDFRRLMKLWDDICLGVRTRRAPCLLYAESDLIIRAMRDFYGEDVEEILIDDPAVYERAKTFCEENMPQAAERLKLYEGPTALFSRYGVEEQIDQIYNRRLPLPNGGHIVIEQTEALVAIDVNSGKYRDEEDLEATALKTNLEAAEAIARQLRLRDLGGVIIIDFIDMEIPSHRRQVERALREAMRGDRAKSWFTRISRFGIVEMTRQRVGQSFEKANYECCQTCGGTGAVRAPRTTGFAVLRELRETLSRRRKHVCEVVAHPDVVDYLVNERRRSLLELETRHQKTVVVRGDRDYRPDQFVVRYR